jgi:hypothetical protein
MKAELGTYLQDHLAGATLAVRMLRRLSDRYRLDPIGHFAKRLLEEVEHDRGQLLELVHILGLGESYLKEETAIVAETATRLKVGDASSSFELFEMLEFLCLGILGKQHLWEALQEIEDEEDPRLHTLDYGLLIERAKAQHQKINSYRTSLAKVTFHQ